MSTHVTRGSGSRSIGSPVPEEICRPDDLGGSVTGNRQDRENPSDHQPPLSSPLAPATRSSLRWKYTHCLIFLRRISLAWSPVAGCRNTEVAARRDEAVTGAISVKGTGQEDFSAQQASEFFGPRGPGRPASFRWPAGTRRSYA